MQRNWVTLALDMLMCRWRLFSLASRDSLKSWRIEPFIMVEGGPRCAVATGAKMCDLPVVLDSTEHTWGLMHVQCVDAILHQLFRHLQKLSSCKR